MAATEDSDVNDAGRFLENKLPTNSTRSERHLEDGLVHEVLDHHVALVGPAVPDASNNLNLGFTLSKFTQSIE